MFDNIDEYMSLDELVEELPEEKGNIYIEDSEQAIKLIASIIKKESPADFIYSVHEIKKDVKQICRLFSHLSLDDEVGLYLQFEKLCAKLNEQQKIRKIQDKSVIGLGGRYSAGKSEFVNSISEINIHLPVDLVPTTSIPTYIIKSDKDRITAVSEFGYTSVIDEEKMGAVTHEFYNKYGIGFSDFIDSIFIESDSDRMLENIAFLDTPGYSKYDSQSENRAVFSDRKKAMKQLNLADYLIWLIDISSCAEITQGDIDFLRELNFKRPILFVFNKADLVSPDIIKEAVNKAETVLDKNNIPVFDITAYSSFEKKEYGNALKKFFSNITKDGKRSNDIIEQFKTLTDTMHNQIENEIETKSNECNNIFSIIKESSHVLELSAVSKIWGELNQQVYESKSILKEFEKEVYELNKHLRTYIEVE